jgi:hypothetical protein
MTTNSFKLPFKKKTRLDKLDDFLKITKLYLKLFIIADAIFYPVVAMVGGLFGFSFSGMLILLETVISVGAGILIYVGAVLLRRLIRYYKIKKSKLTPPQLEHLATRKKVLELVSRLLIAFAIVFAWGLANEYLHIAYDTLIQENAFNGILFEISVFIFAGNALVAAFVICYDAIRSFLHRD